MTSVAGSTQSAPAISRPVVSHEAWLEARKAFLTKEKEFTRLRDELSRERRDLPWERVEKPYAFDGPNGRETLADLFDDQRQLLVYHFMFAPEASEGCKHCSFWADTFNGIDVHLKHRDTSFVAISRAPYPTLDAFKRRMGWGFKWVSSAPSDFNYDYYVSFTPEEQAAKSGYYNYRKGESMPDREGVSAFYKNDRGEIYHTYSTYARGIDIVNGAYNFLDLTALGRNEGDSPQSWVRYHDRY